MGDVTGIGWTDSTFNPWMGCTKVGPGCDHCYAEALVATRWKRVTWGTGERRIRTTQRYWKQPIVWDARAKASRKRHLVFAASLADIFDLEVDPQWRHHFWSLVRETPHLTWQIVTKRIGNWSKCLPDDWGDGYPNVWMIATICNREELLRDGPRLLDCPAVLRGVSYEPALGPLGDILPFIRTCADPETCAGCDEPAFNWIIGGGESNQGGALGRPDKVEWYEDVLTQCRAAGVPYFHKQMARLAPIPTNLLVREFPR